MRRQGALVVRGAIEECSMVSVQCCRRGLSARVASPVVAEVRERMLVFVSVQRCCTRASGPNVSEVVVVRAWRRKRILVEGMLRRVRLRRAW